jgi:hypothetical protein
VVDHAVLQTEDQVRRQIVALEHHSVTVLWLATTAWAAGARASQTGLVSATITSADQDIASGCVSQ